VKWNVTRRAIAVNTSSKQASKQAATRSYLEKVEALHGLLDTADHALEGSPPSFLLPR
jgi:hypothetical protein